MADEIEYLRAQLIGPKLAARYGINPGELSQEFHEFMPAARQSPHYTTEEQEEIQALRDNGHIDEVEYRRAMKQLGIEVTGVEVDLPDDPHGFFADDE